MNKSSLALAIVAVIALAAILLLAKTCSDKERTSQEASRAQQELSNLEAQNAALAAQNREREAQLAAARMAEEARRMADEKAKQDEVARLARIEELNERLKREAEERRRAEQAMLALQQRLEALSLAQAEADARVRALQDAKDAAALESPEAKAAREAELARLRAENDRLQEQYQLALARQIRTEEAILEEGGEVTIPFYEFRSTNNRRREAIMLKERVIGVPYPF